MMIFLFTVMALMLVMMRMMTMMVVPWRVMDFVERGKERPGRYGGTGGEAAADYSSSPGAKPMQQNTILCNAIQFNGTQYNTNTKQHNAILCHAKQSNTICIYVGMPFLCSSWHGWVAANISSSCSQAWCACCWWAHWWCAHWWWAHWWCAHWWGSLQCTSM